MRFSASPVALVLYVVAFIFILWAVVKIILPLMGIAV